MSSQDIINYFIGIIDDFHTLREKLPRLISMAELMGASAKEELELLLKMKKSLIDQGWFDKTWEEYLKLKSDGVDDALIVLSMKTGYNLNYTGVKFRVVEPLEEYLKHNTNKKNGVSIFFNDYIRLMTELRLMFVGSPASYYKAAEEVFWEKNKPKKTRYQRSVVIDQYKTVNLRMIFFPASETVNLLGNARSYSEEDAINDFIKYYVTHKIRPDEILNLFFEELCKVVQRVMAHETITRYYGNSFSVGLQVELRTIVGGVGLFASLLSKRKGVIVTIFPNHNYLMVSLDIDYLFDYNRLEHTLYHEIIHNLDLRDRKEFYTSHDIVSLTLLRSELITVLLTALREEAVPTKTMEQAMSIWKELKVIPIDSKKEYEIKVRSCGGNVHTLSFIMGLQLLCVSLKLGNCKNSPQNLFSLILKSKDKAIATMKIFSALPPKVLFKYYQKKVPKRAQYFTKEFLDDVIGLLPK